LAASSQVDHQTAREPTGQIPQDPVCGAGEIGKQRERLIRVFGHCFVKSGLVEAADLRRYMLKAPVARQRLARKSPAPLRRDGLLCI